MATKYGYVERTADSYINWAEVGKDMSDMLAETSRVREEKKAEIDKVNKEVLDYLATKAPQGESKTVRGMALEYSGNATQYMLDLDRKLKSGQLGLNDFLQARQNLSDGTERAFTMMSEYQQAYGDRMERFRKGENSLLEIANMEQIENFGDFSKSGLFINPYTGQVNVAMKEMKMVDGKEVWAMSANPSKIMSVDAARNLLTTKYDRYDYGAATDTFAKQMGKQVEVLNRAGYSGTVEDITSRTYKDEKSKKLIFDFQEAERKGINALLANDYNRLSVLTDTDAVCSANGLEYRITFDPNDKAPEAIYVESDAQGKQIVKFTDTQKKDSFDFMRDDVRRKYDYVETAQRIPSSGGSRGGGVDNSSQKQFMTAWNKIYLATNETERKIATENMLGTSMAKSLGLQGISPSLDQNGNVTGFTFSYDDPSRNFTKTFDPSSSNLMSWSTLGASEIAGITNADQALKWGGGGKGDQTYSFGDFTSASAARIGGPTKDDKEAEKNYNESLAELRGKGVDLFKKDPDKAIAEMDPYLYSLGVELVGTDDDNITFRSTSDPTKQVTIEFDRYGWRGQDSYDQFYNWLNSIKSVAAGKPQPQPQPQPQPKPATTTGAAATGGAAFRGK